MNTNHAAAPILAIRRDDPEAADRVVSKIIALAEMGGLPTVGVYQKNIDRVDRVHNDMHLVSLCNGHEFRISEDRGSLSTGCRLDRDVISRAASDVERSIEAGDARLLVLNKFGKAEEEGGGMRQAVAMALEAGMPVCMTVGRWSVGALLEYAGAFVDLCDADHSVALSWYEHHFGRSDARRPAQANSLVPHERDAATD